MKTILVDAVYCFVLDNKTIDKEMYALLEKYPNRKILLTGANNEQVVEFGLVNMPYEIFTLKHNPEKTDPKYYQTLLAHYGLKADEVIYFEHNVKAVESAQSIGIKAYHYDEEKRDMKELAKFLDESLDDKYRA